MTVRRLAVGAVVALAAALLACGSDSREAVPAATSLGAATERGPFGVGVTTLELVDTSRPTEANRDFAGAPERKLVVEVWYPAAPAAPPPEARDVALDRSGAPYPLIVFAHGFSSFRRQSATYTQHLASHGYIVAAPDFPLSHLTAPGGPRFAAVLQQPGDVSFVIDQVLAFSEQQGHLLEGGVDGEHIGVSGHSLGAVTSFLTTYGPTRDDRVRAALLIAASGCLFGEEFAGEVSVPIMVLGGAQDLITPAVNQRQAYDLANPPRYVVLLDRADHIRFADTPLTDSQVLELGILRRSGSEELAADAASLVRALGGGGDLTTCRLPGEATPTGDELMPAERQREILRAFATPFFDTYLGGSDEAKEFLEEELPELVPEAEFEFEAD